MIERALAIACAVLIAFGGMQTYRLKQLQIEHLQESKAAADKLAKAESDYREREATLRAQIETIGANYETNRRKLETAATAARADGERLRNQLAAYLSQATPSPRPGCQPDGRAAVLAELLGQADGLAEESALAAEQCKAQVKELRDYALTVSGTRP